LNYLFVLKPRNDGDPGSMIGVFPNRSSRKS
jgi:hypothetical protein